MVRVAERDATDTRRFGGQVEMAADQPEWRASAACGYGAEAERLGASMKLET